MAAPFTTIREALEHASGRVGAQGQVGDLLTNIRNQSLSIGLWEAHAEKFGAPNFMPDALHPSAAAMSTIPASHFDLMREIRERIPPLAVPPRVFTNGISSGGGAPAVLAVEQGFIQKLVGESRKAYDNALDGTDSNPQTPAFSKALAEYKTARMIYLNEESTYEMEKRRYAKERTPDRALWLYDALQAMKAAELRLAKAEAGYAKSSSHWDQVRLMHFKFSTYRAFISQEGHFDSIATSDDNAFTWGVGFANVTGIPRLLRALYKNYPSYGGHLDAKEIALGADIIRALFHITGLVTQPGLKGSDGGRYLFVDLHESPPKVLNFWHGDTDGLRKFLGYPQPTRDRALLDLLPWICRDPDTITAARWMHIDDALDGYTSLGPLALRLHTLSLFGLSAKVRHAIQPGAGILLPWAWAKTKESARKADEARNEEDSRYEEWDLFDKHLHRHSDLQTLGKRAQVDVLHLLQSDSFRRGNFRTRNLDQEPPSNERDTEMARWIMRFVANARELSRLVTIPKVPETYATRPVGNASRVYTQFSDWYHIAAVRHWSAWVEKRQNLVAIIGAFGPSDTFLELGPFKEFAESPNMAEEQRAGFEYDRTPHGQSQRADLERRDASRKIQVDKIAALEAKRAALDAIVDDYEAQNPGKDPWKAVELRQTMIDRTKLGPEIESERMKLDEMNKAPHPGAKDASGQPSLDSYSYSELRFLYDHGKRDYITKKVLSEGDSYYVVNTVSKDVTAKSGEVNVAIGKCSEIWPLWPQSATELMATPWQTLKWRYVLTYKAFGSEHTKEFSTTFDQGEVSEPDLSEVVLPC